MERLRQLVAVVQVWTVDQVSDFETLDDLCNGLAYFPFDLVLMEVEEEDRFVGVPNLVGSTAPAR